MLQTKLENLDNASQFFYIKKISGKYHIIANLGTESTSMSFNIDKDSNLSLDELLGALHHMSFAEKIMKWQDEYSDELKEAGLWAALALIPYPLNKIIDSIRADNGQEGRTILVNCCDQEYLEKLTYDWWAVKLFEKRKALFVEAIDAHKRGHYRSAIHTLLPQIEGLITDWIYENPDRKLHAFRQESKTKEFFDSINEMLSENSLRILVESTANLILKGPVLETFKDWQSTVKNAFANRHVVEHGNLMIHYIQKKIR